MEQEFVRLLVGGLAIVARDGHRHVARNDLPLQLFEALADGIGDGDGVGARALGDGQRDGGGAPQPGSVALDAGDTVLRWLGREVKARDVAHIDGPPVARRQQEVADLAEALQGLARDEHALFAFVANRAELERAVGARQLGRQLLQRDAVERQLFGVGLDADFLGLLADDVGEADIRQLGDFDLQLARQPCQVGGCPACRRLRGRRQRHHHHGHVVDAAPDDQRLRNADGNPVEIGAHLVVDAQDRGIGTGADGKARGDERAIVARLRIDVLDAVDALDDRLQRLRDELDGIFRLQPVGRDVEVHHGHGDLRLLLARQGDQRDEPERERRHEKQRRQGRGDEGAGETAGDAHLHGSTILSPETRPVSTSTRSAPPSSKRSPSTTATSIGPLSVCSET